MYVILDLETDNKKVHGDKEHNQIVAIGLKYGSLDQFEWGLDERDLGRCTGLVTFYEPPLFGYNWLNYVKTIVGHNIKYDLLYLWDSPVIHKFFQEGGMIWDTAIAEYILTGQQHKYPALRDIAVNKYGCKEREKFMEAYWDKKIDTIHIPKGIVLQDLRSDLEDTEAVYLQQLVLALKNKQSRLITAQMDSLLATTDMEYNGMYVNQEVLAMNQNELEHQKNLLSEHILNISKRHWK